jgi:hypothetical protein
VRNFGYCLTGSRVVYSMLHTSKTPEIRTTQQSAESTAIQSNDAPRDRRASFVLIGLSSTEASRVGNRVLMFPQWFYHVSQTT